MTSKITILFITLLLVDCALLKAQAGSPGVAIFEKSCYSCHNIGGGDKQGPDLKGVTERRTVEWLHEFIETPAAMSRKGDPIAADLFKRFAPKVMPDQTLGPDQIDQVLAMITELTRSNTQFVPAGAKLSRPTTLADIDSGHAIFTGATAMKNGAPACIACHSIEGVGALGGGTLGPDLTLVNQKFRDPELIAILQNPNFPTMATIFAQHGLTPDEVVKLFALFQDQRAKAAHGGGVTTASIGLQLRFVIVGAVGMVVALFGMSLLWRKRINGIRQQLVRRSKS